MSDRTDPLQIYEKWDDDSRYDRLISERVQAALRVAKADVAFGKTSREYAREKSVYDALVEETDLIRASKEKKPA